MLDNPEPIGPLPVMFGSTIILVAVGGAFGAALRFGIGQWVARVAGAGFPFGTLTVNVAGSFVMGILFVLLASKGESRLQPLLMTGVLGGFTTFSAFSLDTLKLIEAGRVMAAGGYIASSVLLSVGALVGGVFAMRAVTV
jgi:CrcB protein